MCTLLQNFFKQAKEVSRNVTATSYVWKEDGTKRRRIQQESLTMVNEFSFTENADQVQVSFQGWDGSKMVQRSKNFPLQNDAKKLPFEDSIEERYVVSNYSSTFEPIYTKSRCRTLTFTSGKEWQFWGDFSFSFDYNYHILLQENDESNAAVKSLKEYHFGTK